MTSRANIAKYLNYFEASELPYMVNVTERAGAVLVVEDEPLIRMNAASLIEDAGYFVYEAASADEAIKLLEQHDDIRVIFTDIDMPGSMDGLKLAAYVRGRWPPIKIIVTSGHVKVRRQDLPPDGVFFSKPYRPEQITGKLRELMG